MREAICPWPHFRNMTFDISVKRYHRIAPSAEDRDEQGRDRTGLVVLAMRRPAIEGRNDVMVVLAASGIAWTAEGAGCWSCLPNTSQ